MLPDPFSRLLSFATVIYVQATAFFAVYDGDFRRLCAVYVMVNRSK
jgi:hypothetical protein